MKTMISYMAMWNYGCEAILRSTIAILTKTFGADTKFVIPSFPHRYYKTSVGEIRNLELVPFRWHRRGIRFALRSLGMWGLRNAVFDYNPSIIGECDCALSTGGDPYSAETSEGELPWRWVLLNEYCRKHGIPHIFWGSNIGPFNISEDKLDLLVRQLRETELILARDTGSIEYLARYGIVDNVKRVGDPAFIMEMVPVDIEPFFPKDRGKGVLGFNCSVLSQRYYSNPQAYEEEIQQTCRTVVKDLGYSFVFIPHTVDPFNGQKGDLDFLLRMYHAVKGELKDKVGVVTRGLGARSSKYVISKCDYFAGARMHSTIAAFSCKVPTISLAYSIKAQRLNKDLFGHTNWVLKIPEFAADAFIEKFEGLISQKDQIRDRYNLIIPETQKLSYKAGEYLRELLSGK